MSNINYFQPELDFTTQPIEVSTEQQKAVLGSKAISGANILETVGFPHANEGSVVELNPEGRSLEALKRLAEIDAAWLKHHR